MLAIDIQNKAFSCAEVKFGKAMPCFKQRTMRSIKASDKSKTSPNVKLPIELGDEIDKVLEKKLLGYRPRGEFVAEAVRDKLIQVKK
jgi:hypothetical protein